MQKLSSDKIFTGDGQVLDDHTIILDDDGTIEAIVPNEEMDMGSTERYFGWLLPGFINTHCHLELSHMKGMLPSGTGLLPFIKGVIDGRNIEDEVISEAIKKTDREMVHAGIVAVGDISNTADSFEVKKRSEICYYTFWEVFDLMQSDLLKKAQDESRPVMDHRTGSIAPHAPYSCSPQLFQWINEENARLNCTVSIHNQETDHENQFIQKKTGDFVDFYREIGMNIDHFQGTDKKSLQYILDHIDTDKRILLVHNTMTTSDDIEVAQAQVDRLFWATCPNANLYIENRLPNYRLFIDKGCKMTIGTDSLASNWNLSVWSEICTIKKYHSWIDGRDLLTWATKNGAEALGYEATLGTIEVGKTPGILYCPSYREIDELISRTTPPPIRVA